LTRTLEPPPGAGRSGGAGRAAAARVPAAPAPV